jgi:hypothetical protein
VEGGELVGRGSELLVLICGCCHYIVLWMNVIGLVVRVLFGLVLLLFLVRMNRHGWLRCGDGSCIIRAT